MDEPVAQDPAMVLLDSVPAIMQRADVPGLQLAYLEAGNVTMTAAFGYANSETETPVTDRTVFEAASLSKPVFAYAVLRMVDRGEWDLDEPLWDILEYERLAHDDRARELTTRLVLTHTTGLPNWAWGETQLGFDADPGERWVSSPSIRWPRFHMTSLAFLRTAGRRRPVMPPAACNTTATDYARFIGAIFTGEGLEPETHAAMLAHGANLVGAEWGDDEEAKTHLFWGLGWGLEEGRLGNSFWHWGDQGTARCFVVAYPETGDALVYFTNSANGLAIGPALIRIVFDDDQWALRWLDYDRYDDPGHQARQSVMRAFLTDGPEAGMAEFERARVEHPDRLDEGDVNGLGYVLLRRGAVEEAILVFERNTVDYPESSNVWDSLGEALREAGRLEESIAMYRKSIELDPGNDNAVRFVAEMEAELASAGGA